MSDWQSEIDELQESRELVEAAELGVRGKDKTIADKLHYIAVDIQRKINELEKKNYQI